MLRGRDLHITHPIDFPLRRQSCGVGVALEVIRQYHRWVVPDVLVAGVTRCDSNVR